MIEVFNTCIEGVKVIQPNVFGDSRGSFMELWNEQLLRDAGVKELWVQDNISTSVKGVLRGVHTQLLHPQAKIVSCIQGMIYDVAVDMRPESVTCGRWYGELLTAENHRQMYLPKGVAHGFLTLEDAMVLMKVTTHYTPGDEIGFMWDDKEVGIDWPIPAGLKLILADKDRKWETFAEVINTLKLMR